MEADFLAGRKGVSKTCTLEAVQLEATYSGPLLQRRKSVVYLLQQHLCQITRLIYFHLHSESKAAATHLPRKIAASTQ